MQFVQKCQVCLFFFAVRQSVQSFCTFEWHLNANDLPSPETKLEMVERAQLIFVQVPLDSFVRPHLTIKSGEKEATQHKGKGDNKKEKVKGDS
jgi:hypothetical protein